MDQGLPASRPSLSGTAQLCRRGAWHCKNPMHELRPAQCRLTAATQLMTMTSPFQTMEVRQVSWQACVHMQMCTCGALYQAQWYLSVCR